MTYERNRPQVAARRKAENLYREGTMTKLTLNLEALEVESFHVATPHASRGTVIGAMMTGPVDCVTISCGNSEVRPCRWDED